MKYKCGDILYTANHQKKWVALYLGQADPKNDRIFILINEYSPLSVGKGKIFSLSKLSNGDTIICLTVDK